MSEERQGEQAGAPVEETEASSTEVREAVERAAADPAVAEAVGAGATGADAVAASAADAASVAPTFATPNIEQPTTANAAAAAAESGFGAAPTANEPHPTTVMPEAAPFAQPERPQVAPSNDLPTAGPTQAPYGAASPAGAMPAAGAMSNVDPMHTAPADFTGAAVAQPTAAATQVNEVPIRDGEIRISPDHPMAALYVQKPLPPTPRGNRGAGVLISLLATVGFALVFAGALALILAPSTPPSAFVDSLVESLTAWGTIFGVVAFFVALSIVVLIFGRAGWWAYVLGGFFVGLIVWAAVVAGMLFEMAGFEGLINFSPGALTDLLLRPEAVASFIVAREAAVWFGAWIGARGRKVSRQNAAALAEYETALAEIPTQQP